MIGSVFSYEEIADNTFGKGMVRYERTLEKMMREASNDSRFEDAIQIFSTNTIQLAKYPR